MENIESSKGNLVALDNRIVESICNFSLVEKRVVYLLLSQINKGYQKKYSEEEVIFNKMLTPGDILTGQRVAGEILDSDFWYKISVKEFAEGVGIPSNNARKELHSVAESLRTKFVKIDFGSNVGYVKVNWVSSIMFDAKEDCIGIKWNKDIIPLICDLKEYFIRLRVKEVLLLKSTYSWKLHEILKLLRGMQDFNKDVVIPIEELKRLLNVPEGFQAYKYFKSKVLTPAVKELNAKKVYTQLAFREIKSGKSVVRLEWSWLTIKEIGR
jgi:plasmid replication initiation protein